MIGLRAAMAGLAVGAIAVALGGPAFADRYGAINCSKAASEDEKAICATIELVQLDAQMSVEYGLAKGFVGMGQRGVMEEDQHAWLKKRGQCKADVACLTKSYQRRMAKLEETLDRVKSNGPF